MKKTMRWKAFMLSMLMVVQLLGSNTWTVEAAKTPSAQTESTKIQEPEDVQITTEESAKTLQVKAQEKPTTILEVTDTYINPLYKDVITESMLVQPAKTLNNDGTSVAEEEPIMYFLYTDDAGASVREDMKLRQGTIEVHLASTEVDTSSNETFNADVQALMQEVFAYALMHTGVPTEGDYLMWQYGGWQCSAGASYDSEYCYIDMTYTVTYYTTLEQENAVDAKVAEVLTALNVNEAGAYTKACAIYDYICDNVVYDYENLENEEYKLQYTAYGALIDGTSVCQGYAVLFYRLALELGLDSRLISGIGNGGPHGWNIVGLGNYYYNLDSTWDAGEETYSYFLKCDANFGDHTRDDVYASEEFYAIYPMDSSDYVYQTSGYCGENITWTLAEDGTLTISGTGAMYDASEEDLFPDLEAIKYVVIEEGVTEISACAFYGCVNLQSVSIPTTVEIIGVQAFCFCESLTEIFIPEKVRLIGAGVFAGCSSLTAITVDEFSGGYASVDGVLYTDNMSILIAYPGAKEGDYEVPDGVRFIEDLAFGLGSYPNNLVLPMSIEEIGVMAFAYMYDSLESITFKGSAPVVGESAFDYVTTTIYYPNWDSSWDTAKENFVGEGGEISWVCVDPTGTCGPDLTWVLDTEGNLIISGEGSMYAYSSALHNNSADLPGYVIYADYIQNIILPDALTHIGSFCFADLPAFTEIEIPESVVYIGDNAFARCTALTSIHIPANVKEIGVFGFQDCTAMTEIYFDAPVETINDQAFLNVVATVYYDSSTGDDWSAMVGQNYAGTLTWVDLGAEPEVPEAPAAPEILSVYSKVQTSVKVTWSLVEGAEGYELFRATSPDEEADWTRTKTITNGETNRYTNQGLTVGQTYYYKVRAFVTDADGNRIYSEFSNVKYMPAAVVITKAYSSVTYRIRLGWQEISGADGYQIWRQNEDGTYSIIKTIGDKGSELTNDQGATTGYSNTGLTAGQTYTYKMRAFAFIDGEKIYGAYSDEITAAAKPATPVVTVTSTKAGRAQLSWEALNGGAGYQIWMSDAEDGTYRITKSITDGTTTSYTKYDLESGQTYYFKVRTYTEVEGKKTFSDYSEIVSVVVK